MNIDQRKKHKVIWLLLLVIVPTLLVSTVINLNDPLLDDTTFQNIPKTDKGQIMLENENFTVFLYPKDRSRNLHIFLKKSLESPSSLVYAISKEEPKGTYLGSLKAKGKYVYQISGTAESIKIYDAIKKKEFINIPLSWD